MSEDTDRMKKAVCSSGPKFCAVWDCEPIWMCEDTGVTAFVLSLQCFSWLLKCHENKSFEQYLHCDIGKSEWRLIIKGKGPFLLLFYAFLGSNTTSRLFEIGKPVGWKLVASNKAFLQAAQLFS